MNATILWVILTLVFYALMIVPGKPRKWGFYIAGLTLVGLSVFGIFKGFEAVLSSIIVVGLLWLFPMFCFWVKDKIEDKMYETRKSL